MNPANIGRLQPSLKHTDSQLHLCNNLCGDGRSITRSHSRCFRLFRLVTAILFVVVAWGLLLLLLILWCFDYRYCCDVSGVFVVYVDVVIVFVVLYCCCCIILLLLSSSMLANLCCDNNKQVVLINILRITFVWIKCSYYLPNDPLLVFGGYVTLLQCLSKTFRHLLTVSKLTVTCHYVTCWRLVLRMGSLPAERRPLTRTSILAGCCVGRCDRSTLTRK